MISIIIPVYNTEAYLPKCLNSVLNQTHWSFEALVVVDGSPDRSAEICDQYAARDARIRVIHTENGGISHARNLALDVARGEYIAFLDSDDWMEPDMLKKLHAQVDGSGFDAAMCGAWDVYENKKQPATMCAGLPACVSGGDILRVFLGRSGTMWNKLIGMKAIGNARFRRDIRYGEDIFFLRDVAPTVEKLHIIPDPLYNYLRTREGSITTAGLNSRYGDLLNMTEMAVDVLLSHGYCFEAVSRIRMCAGRLLKAAATAPMKASADYRRRCHVLLRRGNPHAGILLKDRDVHRNSRWIRYAQYKLCALSPESVVIVYKILNRLFRRGGK